MCQLSRPTALGKKLFQSSLDQTDKNDYLMKHVFVCRAKGVCGTEQHFPEQWESLRHNQGPAAPRTPREQLHGDEVAAAPRQGLHGDQPPPTCRSTPQRYALQHTPAFITAIVWAQQRRGVAAAAHLRETVQIVVDPKNNTNKAVVVLDSLSFNSESSLCKTRSM